MPNGDLKPENQAEGLRVYRGVNDLDAQVGQDVNGYRIARDLRDHLTNVFTADALRMFAERKIDALGFEIAVDAQAGAGDAPLIPNVQRAIGLHVVWFTDVPPDSTPAPHVYAFAKQGANDVEPIGETYSLSERFKVSLFATHFYGDTEVTPETWSDAFSNYEGTGLLSGGSQITNKGGKKLLLGRLNNWLVPTVEIALDATEYGDGGFDVGQLRFCITFSTFRHGQWLRNVVRGMSPAPQWGKDVVIEDLVVPRIGRDGLPGNSFQHFVEADGSAFAVDAPDGLERRYLFGGNYSVLHELSSERIDDWLTEWTDVFEWETDDKEGSGLHVLRVPAFGSVPQNCLALQPETKTESEDDVRGKYYEPALRRLDDLVYQCERHGVRLIMPLTNFWNWGGGIPTYLERAGIEKDGDEYTPEQKQKFYTKDKFREAYKHHVETILKRENHLTGRQYREDPTIMMWELANEPRPAAKESGQPKPDPLLNWIEEMSDFINGKDDNHLISTGMDVAFPTIRTASNQPQYVPQYYEDAHTKEHIDAWSVHVWVDGEDVGDHPPLGRTAGASMIRNHAKEAAKERMPCYVGEFGWGNNRANRNKAFKAWKTVIMGEKLQKKRRRVDAALVWDFPGSDEARSWWNFGVFPGDTDTLQHLTPIAKAFGKRNVY